MTGCTQKSDDALFVKDLIYTADMDVDTAYIANKDRTKKIVDVEIPDARADIHEVLYDEESEEADGYIINTIHWEIDSDALDEDYRIFEPLIFEQVNVVWDDSTETLADIGKVMICDTKSDEIFDCLQTRFLSEEPDEYAYFDFVVDLDSQKDIK